MPQHENREIQAQLTRIQQCRLCADALPFLPKPVLQADSRARLLIAGQAPGLKAHNSGIPFDDASGDRLRLWLGLDRQQFYNPAIVAIVPMGFCYPGTTPHGDLPPRAECAPKWRQPLLAAMPEVKLTLLIGRYAQQWHIPDDKRSLTAKVQDWPRYWPDILCLPHPSPRNNRWFSCNPWFEQQLLPKLQGRISVLLADSE